MAFTIDTVGEIYKKEGLNFTIAAESNLVRFQMDTAATPGVRFICRMINPQTLLFYTILPMNIVQTHRTAIMEYLTRVNYHLLMGNFQIDLTDGELSYKVTGVFEPESGLTAPVVLRLTYIGFNMFDRYLPGVFAILYGGKTAQQAFEDNEAAIAAQA